MTEPKRMFRISYLVPEEHRLTFEQMVDDFCVHRKDNTMQGCTYLGTWVHDPNKPVFVKRKATPEEPAKVAVSKADKPEYGPGARKERSPMWLTMEEIRKLLQTNRRPYTRRALVMATGYAPSSITQACDRLVAQGVLRKEGRGEWEAV